MYFFEIKEIEFLGFFFNFKYSRKLINKKRPWYP